MNRFTKYLAIIVAGAATFAAAFAVSAAAVNLAGGLGARLSLGGVGVVVAQAVMAGLLGAIGGASLGVLKTGIVAVSGGIREARFHGTTVATELVKADGHYTTELVDEVRHALKIGFGAGAVLAGAAAVLPTWVLTALRGAVVIGLVFETGKAIANFVALWLEHRRQAAAMGASNLDAFKRHRWERDEEVEEILINVVNLGVLGILGHSLHEIDATNVSEINTGVAMSADEVAALANIPGEVAEIAGVVASEYREMRKAGGWLAHIRRVFGNTAADTEPK